MLGRWRNHHGVNLDLAAHNIAHATLGAFGMINLQWHGKTRHIKTV
jgi:hypothetical protein